MDLRLMASTFAVVFLAELADKTQLATLALAGGNASKWSVFVGAAAALVTSSALAVLLATSLSRVLPADLLLRLSGAFLVVLGVFTLLSGARRETPPDEPVSTHQAVHDEPREGG